jgi:hypothetical protein
MNNAIFDNVFQLDLAKSAVPSGAELMNRVAGSVETAGTGKTGRPPNPEQPAIERLKLNVDPDNPHITALALDPDDSNFWLAGSVVRVVFADGTEQSIVLLNDTHIAPWISE